MEPGYKLMTVKYEHTKNKAGLKRKGTWMIKGTWISIDHARGQRNLDNSVSKNKN